MGAHTTSDDPTRYRIASEVEAWQAKDPIARVRRFLEKQGSPTKPSSPTVDEEATAEAVDLRERVLSHARPAAAADVRPRLPERLARARRAARSSSRAYMARSTGGAH